MNKKLFSFPEGSLKSGSREERLIEGLDAAKMPRHIAVIMDGNGRWAKKRGMPRVFGHREGVKSVRAIVENCARLEIEVLTIYAFSTENWSRPKKEIDALMRLLSEWIHKEVDSLVENGIQFRPIGRWRDFPEQAVKDIEMGIERTKGGDNLLFQVALNYGGRAELIDAVREIAAKRLEPEAIDERVIAQHLYSADVPDPDLMIRTSGELRISNFLLWQLAYAELYVTDTLWPDFRLAELAEALAGYQRRNRRFGGLNGETE